MESNRQKKKKESNFVVQGSILAVASIVVRIIGIAYRIPMINIIGDEGMGYYGTAFNVYNIALLLSSYSLPLAVSKMVSARLAGKQYRNAARILRAALCYATIVGAFAAAVDSLYNRLKNVIQYTEFFQHAAHADSKADNGYVLEHASHAAAV